MIPRSRKGMISINSISRKGMNSRYRKYRNSRNSSNNIYTW